MSCRLPIVLLCCLAAIQAEARIATAADGSRGNSVAGDMPMQERKEREPGPANLEEATEIAVERYGGEVAEAETVEREGRRVHEIRLLLSDGSVRTVRIDPSTGAIIPPRER